MLCERLLFRMRIGDVYIDVGWTIAICALSLVMIVGSVFFAFRVVTRIPTDYFQSPIAPTFGKTSSTKSFSRRIFANAAGAVLVFAGIAMLVLPGQGVLTILAGLLLIDFPGKYQLERKLATIPPLLKVINAIRLKAGRDPLRFVRKND